MLLLHLLPCPACAKPPAGPGPEGASLGGGGKHRHGLHPLASLPLLVLPAEAAQEVQALYGRMVQEMGQKEWGISQAAGVDPAAVPASAAEPAALKAAYWGHLVPFMHAWGMLLDAAQQPGAQRELSTAGCAAAGAEVLDLLLFMDQQCMPACLEVALAALQRSPALDNAVVDVLAARVAPGSGHRAVAAGVASGETAKRHDGACSCSTEMMEPAAAALRPAPAKAAAAGASSAAASEGPAGATPEPCSQAAGGSAKSRPKPTTTIATAASAAAMHGGFSSTAPGHRPRCQQAASRLAGPDDAGSAPPPSPAVKRQMVQAFPDPSTEQRYKLYKASSMMRLDAWLAGGSTGSSSCCHAAFRTCAVSLAGAGGCCGSPAQHRACPAAALEP